MNLEIIEARRDAWARMAAKLPRQRGPATKLIGRDGNVSYSFLGTGLEAHMETDQGEILWNSPIPLGDGTHYQTVDDTTVTLADHYGLHTEFIDLLDAMDAEGHSLEELTGMILGGRGHHLDDPGDGIQD